MPALSFSSSNTFALSLSSPNIWHCIVSRPVVVSLLPTPLLSSCDRYRTASTKLFRALTGSIFWKNAVSSTVIV